MRLYLDANAIIYGVESGPALRRRVAGWIRQALADEAAGLLITSAHVDVHGRHIERRAHQRTSRRDQLGDPERASGRRR